MKFRTAEIITGIIFLIFSLVYVLYITPNFVTNPMSDASQDTMAWTLRPEALPYLNIGVFIIFSLIMLLEAFRSQSSEIFGLTKGSMGKLCFIIAWAFLYTYMLPVFGFLLLSPIFMAVLISALGLRNWLLVLSISIAMPFFMEVFFFQMFQIILPEGRLWK
jgi:hypothetical protein